MSGTSVPLDSLTTESEAGVAAVAEPVGPAAGVGEVVAEHAERRSGLRRPLHVEACLLPLGGDEPITCLSDNIGEGGMHVTVPIGFGLAVGQRHELILARSGASAKPGGMLTGEGHYATVVRTTVQVGEGGDRVGVGLRFDQPLVL